MVLDNFFIMAPFSLEEFLFTPLSSLPGFTSKTKSLLIDLVGNKVIDLLYHFPTKALRRQYFSSIYDLIRVAPTLEDMGHVIVSGKILSPPYRSRWKGPVRIPLGDETGKVELIFFSSPLPYLQKRFLPGMSLLVSGKCHIHKGKIHISHPDKVGSPEELPKWSTIDPIYPLKIGIPNWVVQKAIKELLLKLPEVPEWLDSTCMQLEGWPSWKRALHIVHYLEIVSEQEYEKAYTRLAYDEILAQQLSLQLLRKYHSRKKGRSFEKDISIQREVENLLPFSLTSSQKKVLQEISNDMANEDRMIRLLQGDVGSGKTIVAFLSLLQAIKAEAQAVFLIPTETLSYQHYEKLLPFTQKLNISMALLTGSLKKKEKKMLLSKIEEGSISLVVGTHALLEEDVVFKDLGFIVIDEQHRFGVAQRLSLLEKGRQADMLVMTATPIPRTLQLTMYGDMEVSFLYEKPQNRKPIVTRILPISRIEEIVEALKRLLDVKQKIYWVCPIIEESEALDLTAAEKRFLNLKEIFKDRVRLLHGRLKNEEKQEVMRSFKEGSTDILVSTTVIEVGMDVPEATLMVIEHAERFGLAQLHQLRGRVGRSDLASSCLLLYGEPLSVGARHRLQALKNTDNGFLLAEEDLKIRGGGTLLGTIQSGKNTFKVADLFLHSSLLKNAQKEAKLIVERELFFRHQRVSALRLLLSFFYGEESSTYLLSG